MKTCLISFPWIYKKNLWSLDSNNYENQIIRPTKKIQFIDGENLHILGYAFPSNLTGKSYVFNNYLRQPLEIRDEYRYVVDKEEFRYWLGLIPNTFNAEMNVPGRRMKVREIVEEYT